MSVSLFTASYQKPFRGDAISNRLINDETNSDNKTYALGSHGTSPCYRRVT